MIATIMHETEALHEPHLSFVDNEPPVNVYECVCV